MVEMLPLISIAPEMNLTYNPATGIIGAALEEAVIVSMDGINAQITELEMTVDDLYHALDPTTTSLGAFPGREGVYMNAGKLTNLAYGFIIGLVVMVALLLR